MANTRPELCCYFCYRNHDELVTAVKIVPQRKEGEPAVWKLVCNLHLEEWFKSINPNDQLPMFDIPNSQ